MLTISRETDYASRIILHLALLPPGSRTTADEIARRRLVPHSLIRRLVARLRQGGLLLTTRGRGGGITLAKPPAEISLLDVIQIIEGPLALNICTNDPSACPLTAACPVHDTWVETQQLLAEQLRKATFAKLSQREREKRHHHEKIAANVVPEGASVSIEG